VFPPLIPHRPTVRLTLTAFLTLPLFAACSSHSPSPELRAAEASRLVGEGRKLLDEKRPADAQVLFEQAVALDDGLTQRTWLLRSWMDQGRSNDTLDQLDALQHAGETGTALTYLYGMAFARRADTLLADNVQDSSLQMNLLDATTFLKKALDADAASYPDAYPALARAAWLTQDLELSRWAADHAVAAYPDDPAAWVTRGRSCMGRFLELREADPATADAAWEEAVTSLANAVRLFGAPTKPSDVAALTNAATELGNAYLWKEKAALATDAYATAAAWSPDAFAYDQARQGLAAAPAAESDTPVGFRAALEEAAKRIEARGAADDPRTSTLFWWLGYARFAEADWEGSETGFTQALARRPDIANAWFYIALGRQYRHDSAGALAAIHTGWDIDPVAMVTATAAASGSLRGYEDLIGWCAEQTQNLEAAFLAEIMAQAFPGEPRHWNNLGLFLRDEGERLEIAAYKNKTPEPEEALLADLYGRAFAAYERALALNPDDPQLINDTALMLHYHLGRDLDRAEAMYRRAIELAAARLAESGLSEYDRARFERSHKEATDNLDYLLHPEKLEAKDEEATEATPTPPTDGATAEAKSESQG